LIFLAAQIAINTRRDAKDGRKQLEWAVYKLRTLTAEKIELLAAQAR
jgi:hypothetical protein